MAHPDATTAVDSCEVAGGGRLDGIMRYPAFDGVHVLAVTALTPAGSADRALVPWTLKSVPAVRRLG